MTRLHTFSIAVAVALSLAGCKKPSDESCRKAINNMRHLMGTENLRDDKGIEGEVRRCKGGSTKKAVDCAIKATTLDDLRHCDFFKVPENAKGIGEDTTMGSGSMGSGAMGSGAGSAMGSGAGAAMGSAGTGSAMGSGAGSAMGSGAGAAMGSGAGSAMGSGAGAAMGSAGAGSAMGSAATGSAASAAGGTMPAGSPQTGSAAGSAAH